MIGWLNHHFPGVPEPKRAGVSESRGIGVRSFPVFQTKRTISKSWINKGLSSWGQSWTGGCTAGRLVSLQKGFLVVEEHNRVSDTPSWACRVKHARIRTLFIHTFHDIRIRMLCIIVLPISTIPKHRTNSFKTTMWDWKRSQRGELAEVRELQRVARPDVLPASLRAPHAHKQRQREGTSRRDAACPPLRPSQPCKKSRRDSAAAPRLRCGAATRALSARWLPRLGLGRRLDPPGSAGTRWEREYKTSRPSQKGGLKFSEPCAPREKRWAGCVGWFMTSVFSEQLFFSPRGKNATK